ncbi:CBS domain-containing protein [Thermofilum pendens]|uniref:Signal-transduction protein with CBS domains n=1 Tax=Thermofilum pendens (strain DSM 2475 / Hrk 5) TaxID=368408 RepID=A1S180_THEPD|nr:CBS domain-containing protein [Thermofilum pendens]ABL79210.1 putative signal-transduction protein with CBS domains [Thermofilum pendens Hrk 5]
MSFTGPPSQGVFTKIDPLGLNDTVSVAAERMWRFELPAVPVVDGEGRYAGIVSIFSLLRTRYQAGTKLGSVLEKAPVVEPSLPLTEVARMLVKTGQPGLAVVEGGRVVGIVSARRLLAGMGLSSRVTARHIAYRLDPLAPSDPLEKARKLIVDLGLRLVPVAEDGKAVGVVRVYDLVNFVYNTPLRRERLGEVKGETSYFLEQPVAKIATANFRTVHVDGYPSVEDIAEGSVVVDSSGKVYGIISPYLLLRRLLPAIEEAKVPLRVEGVDELDFIQRNLIYRKSLDIASEVSRRARLLEMSVVLKSREKSGNRRRYDAIVSIKLDVDSYSARSSGWDAVETVYEALDSAYKVFSKSKEKKREKRISLARLRKILE